MRRRQGSTEWRVHQAGPATASAISRELTPVMLGWCTEENGAKFAQTIREDLVDGMRREMLLQRIRERLGSTAAPAHMRYTRRSWLELQGRRRSARRNASA